MAATAQLGLQAMQRVGHAIDVGRIGVGDNAEAHFYDRYGLLQVWLPGVLCVELAPFEKL
jgi:hypothetical protein